MKHYHVYKYKESRCYKLTINGFFSIQFHVLDQPFIAILFSIFSMWKYFVISRGCGTNCLAISKQFPVHIRGMLWEHRLLEQKRLSSTLFSQYSPDLHFKSQTMYYLNHYVEMFRVYMSNALGWEIVGVVYIPVSCVAATVRCLSGTATVCCFVLLLLSVLWTTLRRTGTVRCFKLLVILEHLYTIICYGHYIWFRLNSLRVVAWCFTEARNRTVLLLYVTLVPGLLHSTTLMFSYVLNICRYSFHPICSILKLWTLLLTVLWLYFWFYGNFICSQNFV